jgi:hypothetical protein
VIVNHHQGACVEFQRSLDDLPGVNGCLVDRAPAMFLGSE